MPAPPAAAPPAAAVAEPAHPRPAREAAPSIPGGNHWGRVLVGILGGALLLDAGRALVSGPTAGGVLSTGLFYALAAVALGLVAARASLVPAERHVLVPATIAMVGWFAGTVAYAAGGDALGALSSLSPGDLALACCFAPAAVALERLVRARVEPFQRTVLLDGLIFALAAGALASALLAEALAHISVAPTPGALKLLWPLGAIMLLAFSTWVMALTGWQSDRAWTLLMSGLGLAALSSTAFVLAVMRDSYSTGGELDTLWVAAGLGIALAVWQPANEPIRVRLEPLRRITTTSGAALTALVLLVIDHFTEISTLAAVLGALTLIAVIARAGVSFTESIQMFADARVEAQTDSLTGLGNRRKLMSDLRRELDLASVESPRVLAMFDLDGFKRYNDTYGHPAGDTLLTRLGANLGRAIRPYGNAYRLGGDEFCVLVVTGASSAKTIIALSAAALSEHGEGFSVRSSHGAVILPHEARDATLALRIADQRMYAQKDDRRSSASRQTRDILLQVLHEREPELGDHLKGVAKLALGVATRLDLVAEQLDEVVRAAELHDVGKMAVPDEILRKSGPLTDEEWSFVRQHTIIGERILSAAPALLPVAKLVRASHEHFDGSGYPDGLAGEGIPLGARIVSVCDAFDAMTSSRPYRPACTVEEAVAELRACAGTQFDPAVVEAFCEEIAALGPRYSERVAASGVRAGRASP
jgi:diguanylate cyclase (GGDEF)-like protein